MRKLAAVSGAALCLLTGIAICSQDVPWPCFRHDSQNSGRADYIGADVSALKWSFQTLGQITSSPALGAQGRIYVGSRDGKLYCLVNDGRLLWAYDTHATIDYSSPAVAADGTIYVTAFEYGDQSEAQQGLLAINPDGTRKWLYPTVTSPLHAPVIGPDGSIVFGANSGGLTCVGADGALRWVYSGYRTFSIAPAFGPDGTIYAADLTGKLNAVSPDGVRKWVVSLGGMVNYGSASIGSDGTIYQGCSDGKVYAFSPAGALKWACPVGGPISSTPAVADGMVYISADDGKLHAVGTDGVQRWAVACAHPRSSPAIDYLGKIYVGTQLFSAEGRLMADLAKATQTNSSPAIGLEGTVFVGLGSALLAMSTGPVDQPQFNKPPVCSIAASPLGGRAPLPVSFRAEAGDPDGQVVRAAWDFGDGSGAEGMEVAHTYVAQGSYQVQLTVYDNRGASASAEVVLDILPPNQAPAVWASTDVVEGPASLLVNMAAAGSDPENGPLTYAWDFGDGSTGSGNLVSHTYVLPGTYVARVTVTDDGGLTASAEVVIKVTAKHHCHGKHLGLIKNGKWWEWLKKWLAHN